MMEEGVNHACLQNVRRILRIDSYIPTYSIGKKTFVFFSLQHHFISCKNIWISLISICTSWISLTIVHAVNGSVSTQCPKGFEHIVCLEKNIILTASWPELPLHILTRQSLGSAWISLDQLDFWVEILAPNCRVSVQSLLDMFIITLEKNNFYLTDSIMNNRGLEGSKSCRFLTEYICCIVLQLLIRQRKCNIYYNSYLYTILEIFY